ncbi:hypothetical protein V1511DRAFT_522718 [Dipodascopsis uninucleata]
MFSIRATDEDKSQLLLDLLKNSFASAKFTGKAVWVGLLTSLGSSAFVFIMFCILRPRNTVIYAPKTRVVRSNDSDTFSISTVSPPRLGPGAVSWISKVYQMSDDDLLDMIGLDAVVYLKFMKMCIMIFLCLSFLGLTVAIPINVTFALRNDLAQSASSSDAFLLMTPTLVTGTPMIAHSVLAYAFDVIVCFFLYLTYRDILRLRQRYFNSEIYRQSLSSRTLLITEISKKYRSNRGIAMILAKAKQPRRIEHVVIARNVSGLGSLVKTREKLVLKLEKVLSKYLKDVDNVPVERPTMKPEKGTVVDCGNRVDAIDYLISRIQELENAIKKSRNNIDSRKEMPYGFASYHTIGDAHTVAKANDSANLLDSARINLAPRREDIMWENLTITKAERLQKANGGKLIFFVLCISWIIPNAFIGTFLSQISRIGVLWESFGEYMDKHPTAFSFIQGFISPAVTSAIFLILPLIMRKLSSWQGALTKSSRERNTLRKLYIFFVFNNLFVFTIFGVAWSAATQLYQLMQSNKSYTASEIFDALSLGKQISNSIIGVSSFWVMYIIRVNFGSALDLIQVSNLLIRSFARRFLAPTPRQMIKWTAPPNFEYAAHYNWLLFYVTIALSFTTIQPLVLVVTAFFFTIDRFLKKYSLTYVFATKVESGGSFWQDLFDRVLFACGFGNIVMFLVTWNQGSWKIGVSVLPLPILLICFKLYCRSKFDSLVKYDYTAMRLNSKVDYELGEWDIVSTGKSSSKATSQTSYYDLRAEFGDPALYRKLIVPMVKSSAQHLLHEVFKGKRLGDENIRASIHENVNSTFEIVNDNELDIVKFQDDPNFLPHDDISSSTLGPENDDDSPDSVKKNDIMRSRSGPFESSMNITQLSQRDLTSATSSTENNTDNPYAQENDDVEFSSSFPTVTVDDSTRIVGRPNRRSRVLQAYNNIVNRIEPSGREQSSDDVYGLLSNENRPSHRQ